jgi:hypothetical protein
MERKKGRNHNATARERNQHPQAQKRNKTQPTLLNHVHDATKFKTPAVPPPAATHHARHAPTPQRLKQRRSNQNQSPREKPRKE